MNEEIFEKARQLRAAGVPIAEIERYLQSKLGAAPQETEPEPGIGTKALGTAASLVRDIPGMEAAQGVAAATFGNALTGDMSGAKRFLKSAGTTPGGLFDKVIGGVRGVFGSPEYNVARQQIRDTEDAAPRAATVPARLVGGTVGAMAMPGGAVSGGALFGGAGGLLASDADATLEERLARGTMGAGLGAVAGKAGDVLGTLGKAASAPALGKAQAELLEANARASKPFYRQAMREGDRAASRPTPKPLTDALLRPDIEPFTKAVMNNRKYAAANDATIARAVFRRMGKEQGGLIRRLNQNGYDSAVDDALANVSKAKEELAAAMNPIMPTFKKANAKFAEGKRAESAFNETATGVKRVAKQSAVAPKNLQRNSPQALEERIAAMSPREADAALTGGLGGLKETMNFGFTGNALTGFGTAQGLGVLPAMMKANRASPFIRKLEKQAGKSSRWNVAAPAGVAATRWLEDLLRDQ